ncbi:MAG TPA: DUF4363 family protein, partial [Bacillota bacterium]
VLTWSSFRLALVEVLPGGGDLPGQLEQLEEAVRTEHWSAAARLLPAFEQGWQRVEPWLELIHEKETLSDFRRTLARLEAAVAAREATTARSEVRELRLLWDDLNQL